MAFHQFQEGCVRRFFPDLIEAVRSLDNGEGEFRAYKPKYPRTQGVSNVLETRFRLEYDFKDGHAIEFRWAIVLRAGVEAYDVSRTDLIDWSHWVIESYGLHYGRHFDDALFRFDMDQENGYHVHMPPRPKDHTPADTVTLRTNDMLPVQFVEIVRKFRLDGKNPLKRKKP